MGTISRLLSTADLDDAATADAHCDLMCGGYNPAQARIEAESITSGDNKAMGSPFEPQQPEHRALLQEIVDEFYQNFLGIVTARRPELSSPFLEEVTDGRVVTGRRAHEVGLVDEVGDLHDAFSAAKRLADTPTARLVKYHRPLRNVASPYAAAPALNGPQVNLLQLNVDASHLLQAPGAYYLWDPTAFGSD